MGLDRQRAFFVLLGGVVGMVVMTTWCLCQRLNRPIRSVNTVPFSHFRSVVYKYLSPSRNFVEFSFYDDTLARCEEESTLLSLCEGPTPIGRHRSCAVVGHGASVSTGGCEEAINKHDFVIRCNLPPIKESNTNTRQLTNLTIVDFETLKKLDENTLIRNLNLNLNSPLLLSKPQEKQTFVIGYIGDFEPYEFGTGKVKHKMCSDINAVLQAQNRQAMLTFSMEPLTDITRRILREFNIILPEPPSAALVSALLALSFCDSVTLYGNTTSGDVGHLVNEQLPNVNDAKLLRFQKTQNMMTDEYHLLQRLHEQGNIRLVGSCKD